MSGDVHVRFCESLKGKFLRATRRVPRRQKKDEVLLQLCCIKDEGRSLEAAMQVEASNHRKLRR